MNKRTLTTALLAIVMTLAFQTGMYGDFIAKTATVHTTSGGATAVLDIDLINGHTSLGALFLNNVTTNSFPFGSGSV